LLKILYRLSFVIDRGEGSDGYKGSEGCEGSNGHDASNGRDVWQRTNKRECREGRHIDNGRKVVTAVTGLCRHR
jgi:hypothetical protein